MINQWSEDFASKTRELVEFPYNNVKSWNVTKKGKRCLRTSNHIPFYWPLNNHSEQQLAIIAWKKWSKLLQQYKRCVVLLCIENCCMNFRNYGHWIKESGQREGFLECSNSPELFWHHSFLSSQWVYGQSSFSKTGRAGHNEAI